MQIAKWNEAAKHPHSITKFGKVEAGNGVPYRDMATLQRMGYHEYIPVELAEGEELDNVAYTLDGGVIRQGGTVVSAAEMQARAEAEAEQQRIKAYAQQMAYLAPVLDTHPDPADLVAGGMFYRLPDPEDAAILTLWYVRDSDLIAQQLSSHDAAGHPVQRSVNLKTRESVEYNMEEIVKGLKGNKDKAKKTGNVGAEIRRGKT